VVSNGVPPNGVSSNGEAANGDLANGPVGKGELHGSTDGEVVPPAGANGLAE